MSIIENINADLINRLDYFGRWTKPVKSDDSVINAYDLMMELKDGVEASEDFDLETLNISQEVTGFQYKQKENQADEKDNVPKNLLKATIMIHCGKVYGVVGFQSKRDTFIAAADPLERAKDILGYSAEYFLKKCFIERKDVDPAFLRFLPDDFVKRNGIQK